MMMANFTSLLQGLQWKGNIYRALVLSLLWVMFLFTVSRLAFYLYNLSFFPGMTPGRLLLILWGGLHFDLTATLYTNALFILLMILPFRFRFRSGYRMLVKWVFYLTNGIAFAFNTADIVYYRFTLRRTTASFFSQFQHEENLGMLLPKFLLDYWYVTLFFILLIVLLVRGYRRISIQGPQLRNPWVFYLAGLCVLPLCAVLFVGGVRGDFRYSTRPITLSNAGEFVSEPRDMNIVLNTPFAVYRTLQKPLITKSSYFSSEAALEQVYTPVHAADTGGFRKLNVVVIILESFGREYFGVYNSDLDSGRYKGFTPFLDSLIGESTSYRYAYANGRKSIDALPSVLTGIPSIEVPYVLSHYSSNKVNSIGSLLKNEGYHTSFFHGAPNGSMGFKAFVNVAGYTHYYGKTEYESEHGTKDFDGFWGIWDDAYLQYFADKLNTFPQPFHSAIFTTSSHHPYNIPARYEEIFKGGSMSIYRTIQFTDHALRLFFQKASTMPFFRNTLFVITADHCSAQVAYEQYRTVAGYFQIPMIFYQPGSSDRGIRDDLAQQIDILPTVLGSLHYPHPYVAYGTNLFDSGSEKFVFNYLDNTYQLFSGDYLLRFDGTRSVSLYRFKTDIMLGLNILKEQPEVAAQMERKLKAIIQQYNNRMVDDKLTL